MYWQAKLVLGMVALVGLAFLVYSVWPHLPAYAGNTGAAPPAEPAAAEPAATAAESGTATTPVTVAVARPPALVAPGAVSTAKPGAPAAAPAGRLAPKLKHAKGLLDKDPVTARRLLENILKDPNLEPYSEAWRQTLFTLGEANMRLLFTDTPCPEKVEYVIKPGDSLVRIAERHHTTRALIARSNKLDPDKPALFPDHVLRIYKGDWNLKVSKANFLLVLSDGDRPVKAYRVGIGKQNRTPEGTFIVTSKQRNPVWYPGGKSIPADDPRNPLGTRWLALTGTEPKTATSKGYGIHGTREPDTIGTESSNGCIRLLNNEVEELYDIVPEGTPLVIVP